MVRADDEAELRRFVEARWPALVRFGVLLTGDRGHAEDLVQTALERCWTRWSRIEAENPERYVKSAMANLAASRWRHRSRRVAEAPLEAAGDPAHGRDEQARLLLRDELWRELQVLPRGMRAVVVLRFVEDLSEAQTAAALGCSVGSVKSQASRGLARLRARMGTAAAPGRPGPVGTTTWELSNGGVR